MLLCNCNPNMENVGGVEWWDGFSNTDMDQ